MAATPLPRSARWSGGTLVGVLLASFGLLLAAAPTIPEARAATCAPVTRGTLADVVAVPGFVVVADIVSYHVEGTPTVDTYAVREVIRRTPAPARRGPATRARSSP